MIMMIMMMIGDDDDDDDDYDDDDNDEDTNLHTCFSSKTICQNMMHDIDVVHVGFGGNHMVILVTW